MKQKQIPFNFLASIPQDIANETFETVLENSKVKIERIISYGDFTPADFWYNQIDDEFVMVLEGSGKILYEDQTTILLTKGDSLFIPAYTKHRVIFTENPTIWLAMFIKK